RTRLKHRTGVRREPYPRARLRPRHDGRHHENDRRDRLGTRNRLRGGAPARLRTVPVIDTATFISAPRSVAMTIRTIGVPMDLGADRRGVDMGPSAIRYAGLSATLDDIDRSTIDRGDLTVPHAEERDP